MKKNLLAAVLVACAGFAQANAATYAIDPTHSFITYEVIHFGTSTSRGRFDRKEGSVTIDRAAKTGKVELTIDMRSVSSGVALLDKELGGKDFFNSAEFPTARFVGDKFEFDGDKLSAVGGVLTLLGKSQPVTLKAARFNCYQHPFLKREVCGGDFETTIQRSAFGNTTLAAQDVVGDSVRLLVQVEGIKQ